MLKIWREIKYEIDSERNWKGIWIPLIKEKFDLRLIATAHVSFIHGLIA